MNNKTRFTIILFLLVFIIFLITNNYNVLESVNFSISIWKDNLFPTLFPFFVVSSLLIKYNFIDLISPIFNKFLIKLYKLPGCCSFVLIASLFSGFPSGAKYTTNLLDNNLITEDEATRLLVFTHYSNPLFIITFIGTIIFNNKTIGFIILISHILGGLITGILFNINKEYKINLIKSKINNNYLPLGKILSDSIMDSLNTLFLLLGIITIFSLFISMFNNIFNLSPNIKTILSGTLEMTQGIKHLSNLNIFLYYKILLTTIFISFGGFSVHLQVLSIISSYNIKYKSFLYARIIHSIISSGLVSILFFITY